MGVLLLRAHRAHHIRRRPYAAVGPACVVALAAAACVDRGAARGRHRLGGPGSGTLQRYGQTAGDPAIRRQCGDRRRLEPGAVRVEARAEVRGQI